MLLGRCVYSVHQQMLTVCLARNSGMNKASLCLQEDPSLTASSNTPTEYQSISYWSTYYALEPVLSTHKSALINSQHPCRGSIVIPILQMQKLRIREVKGHAQGHTAAQWQIWLSSQALDIPLFQAALNAR